MKKGFTLIELLAVISLVLVVTVGTTIGIKQMTDNNSESEYNKQIDKLKLAAKIYVHEQPFYKLVIYNEQNSANGQCIYLKTLMDYNLISPNLVDPRTNSVFDETAKIRVKYVKETDTLIYDYVEANVSCISDIVNVIDYSKEMLLSEAIKRDNPEYLTQIVSSDTMFQSVAKTDMGLWTENRAGKTEDDLPVYFYRGDIDNNYVFFAEKMWRIVRINEDGSIKLILGGNSATDGYGGTTTSFNPNINLAKYVDYNDANNALRAANENWYSNDTKGNLDEYESYIADTKFCNDKSSVIFGNYLYYGAFARLSGYSLDGRYIPGQPIIPQYKCPNVSDNYIYKIGALTADEVAYAGGRYAQNNTLFYLYDNTQNSGGAGHWWLLSPFYYENNYVFVSNILGRDSPGFLNLAHPNNNYNFRPVISLKSNTIILNGNGQFTSPYLITD